MARAFSSKYAGLLTVCDGDRGRGHDRDHDGYAATPSSVFGLLSTGRDIGDAARYGFRSPTGCNRQFHSCSSDGNHCDRYRSNGGRN